MAGNSRPLQTADYSPACPKISGRIFSLIKKNVILNSIGLPVCFRKIFTDTKVVRGLDKDVLKREPGSNQSGFVQIKKFHFVILLFLVVFLSAGITTFALTFGDEKAVTVKTDREEFRKVFAAFDSLMEKYYEEVDENILINGAIEGMIQALDDPYTDYMNEEEAKSFYQGISSSFEGIGAEIGKRGDDIIIVSPLKGSPAEKAGLKPDDKILSVDGKSLRGMSTTEAVKLIRGEKGSKVTLQIERAGVAGSFEMTIVRDEIPIHTVYGELRDDGIAIVQITSFSKNTANELEKMLNEFQEQGMKGIILDLRQNPGGILNQAEQISSLFVPEGKVIYKIEDRHGNIKEVRAGKTEKFDLPLVVVIDKGSASASEIFAAAVSESAGVPLVGENTFGKGTAQRGFEFEDGSHLKITTEKWLTPKGTWVHNKGIKPDYEVFLPDYASLSIINPEDKWKLSNASAQIKSAQQMLKALGFDPGRDDGYFDKNTEEAVKRFQKAENLPSDGIITGETSQRLMEKIREKIEANDTQIEKAIEVLKEKM